MNTMKHRSLGDSYRFPLRPAYPAEDSYRPAGTPASRGTQFTAPRAGNWHPRRTIHHCRKL